MTVRIAVAGELLWDLHGDAELDRAVTFRRVLGGATANVAMEIARHEVPVAALGVVGADAFGRGMHRTLTSAGVDVSALRLRAGQTGSVFVVPYYADRQRFYSYRPTVTWPKRPPLPSSWRRGTLAGCWLHISAVNPAEVEIMTALAARVRARGAQVSIDMNARPRAWRTERVARRLLGKLARQAAWIKTSDDDLAMLGWSAEGLWRAMAANATLIETGGRRAMRVSGPSGEMRVGAPRVRAVRAVGAGDRFCATLLRAGLHGLPQTGKAWRAAIKEASQAAARYVAADSQ